MTHSLVRTAGMERRRLLGMAAAAVAGGMPLLAGCGSMPSTPARLYRLPIEAPGSAAGTAAPASANAQTWELANNLGLPEYVDREAIVLGDGGSGLRVLGNDRWAEPLRDAVPRVLRSDLAALRGASRVWAAPAPPGVAVDRQLRVDVLALQADEARSTVELQARWWLVDIKGQAAPSGGNAVLRVPTGGGDVASIVAAHRVALWQLAQQIARTA